MLYLSTAFRASLIEPSDCATKEEQMKDATSVIRVNMLRPIPPAEAEDSAGLASSTSLRS
jgi:hypothetical protein